MLGGLSKYLRDRFSIDVPSSGALKPNFTNGFQVNGSDYSATELNTALGSGDPGTAGTITASKPVIVDSNKQVDGGYISRFVYSIAAASSENAATSLTAYSNGTKTLPVLAAGDRVRIRGVVNVTTLGSATSTNDTFQVTVNLGGQVVFDTTAIPDALVNDFVVFDCEVVIRTIHASTGTAYKSNLAQGTLAGSAFSVGSHGALSSLASSAAMDVVVKGSFGNAANKSTLQMLDITVN